MQAETEKLPPHDIDAERCTIASMLLLGDDRDSLGKILRIVWRDAFYQPDHQIYFESIAYLFAGGKAIDSVTVRAELRRREVFDQVGGIDYLRSLLDTVPSPMHGATYAATVAMRATEREAIRSATALATRLMQPLKGDDSRAIIQKSADRLSGIAKVGRDLRISTLAEAIDRFIDTRKDGELTWMETGIGLLDTDYLGVLRNAGYTLVAARPSMGKSTFIRDLLRRKATDGEVCGLVAVEENEDKIAGNYLSAESGVENSRVAYEYDRWTSDDHDSIGKAIDACRKLPIFVTDAALNLNDVMLAAETMVSQHKCRIIAIDHIHLVAGGKSENREQQISEISGAFKEFIKRRGIVGIVAAQLNRPEKGVCPPAPHLTDLRGSGALEEHADSVLMLHREDYYYRGRDGHQANGLCQILIRKNRNGCVGEIVMRADLAHQRFEEEQPEILQLI